MRGLVGDLSLVRKLRKPLTGCTEPRVEGLGSSADAVDDVARSSALHCLPPPDTTQPPDLRIWIN
eukprot:767309-Hanusia_phi.AAC.1